ncbi:keratinocyte proline-rich protein-like isoform X2 [Bombus flavifrons]|uniref:keratinocyte proline-rich protein-like isoform X2 n=1 Tax=Bombus flavifrons TaxID=103934 RepID=UPI0037048FE1
MDCTKKVCPEKVNRNVHETSRHNKAQHAVNTVETRRDTTIRRRIDRQPIENKIPFEEIAATRTIEKFLCDLQVLILISSGVLSLFLAVSAAIIVDKHEKTKPVASKRHDKRGLVNLEYGVPDHPYGHPEPAPVFEPSLPDVGGHLESVIAPVAPPPPLPVAHAAPAVPVPVPQPVPHPVPVAVPQPVPHPVPVAVPQPVPHPVPVAVPVTKHVAVPVPVDRAVPFPVDRPVPVPVAVPVPKPYPVHVEKIVHVDRPVPVPFDRPVHVPVDRPVAVPVPVPKPYPVPYEKVVHVDRPYPVHVAVPYHVPKPYPVPVAVHAHKTHGWFK